MKKWEIILSNTMMPCFRHAASKRPHSLTYPLRHWTKKSTLFALTSPSSCQDDIISSCSSSATLSSSCATSLGRTSDLLCYYSSTTRSDMENPSNPTKYTHPIFEPSQKSKKSNKRNITEQQQQQIPLDHELHAMNNINNPKYPPKNYKLEAIKSSGLTQLQAITRDILSRSSTQQPLFENDHDHLANHPNSHDANHPPNPNKTIPQLQEATRLEHTLQTALHEYSLKHPTFTIRRHPIEILGVHISPDLRHARIFWCLPHALDLSALSESTVRELMERMQRVLDEKGKVLQGLVHGKLRGYYPPRLKFVAAEHVRRDGRGGVSLGDRGKWS